MGIDVAALNRHLFQTVRKAELELHRLALEKVRYFAKNRIAIMEITLAMLEQSGAGADELETISSLPAQIEGVKAAATLKELAPNRYKVSLRTDGSVHGGKVCAQFGGGGHAQAAGCTLEGSYAEVEEKIVGALMSALENQ